MEPGFPEGFDDGCCMAGVAARADADRVAAALGEPVAIFRDDELLRTELPGEPRAFVVQLAGHPWSTVNLEASVFDPAVDTCDSDPLLRQARAVLGGEVPTAPREGRETPVTTAARLQEQLRVRTVGLWGSDQGPGLLGAAFFAADGLERAISAASPHLLDRIAAMRQREDDAEVSEVLDAVEAYCEDHVYAFSRVAGGHDVGGTAEELLDEAFRSLGLAWVDEPIAGWAEALCGGDAGDLAKLVGALYVVT